ncbi:MAG TPA: DUF4278 domain-containing protein [Leptolyngbyaceae cyanobacterium M33_DOE_097]|uniref:DUF4278 domain-containing protein n=1 Tax=Oscillatoriales cyanobacterium SpSt-418 TaxID=2282169 RepID=A0A7C3KD60_9CYAN|nr:DUF4278 domain-containing protein [Leptolyngbyaceae cyanobacterium M33_DOE_097]
MTLTFLGNSYETLLSEVAQIPTAQTGKYRGATVHFTAARVAPRSNRQLTYRGNVYSH